MLRFSKIKNNSSNSINLPRPVGEGIEVLVLKIITLAILLLLIATNLEAQTTTRRASWTDNSTNETSFYIQQCPSICLATSLLWKTIGTVPADQTFFVIPNVPVPSVNSYRVAAQNTAGSSPFTPIIIDDIIAPPPTIPNVPSTFALPPCKVLTETVPSTTPKTYICS